MPEMNRAFAEVDGKPAVVEPEHVNLGLAIDLAKPDGTRQLLVPDIKGAETLDFAQFWAAYEDLVRRARDNKLTADDFAGTTISLTNPGTIGTVHSVPRLMAGQGAIIGVGAMEYPAEFQGASAGDARPQRGQQDHDAHLDLRPPDHPGRAVRRVPARRPPAAARRGRLLRRGLPRRCGSRTSRSAGSRTSRATHDDDVNKTARVQELIHAYRVRGHLMADTDPLEYRQRRHPDLDVVTHGLTLWDLDREFATGGFGGKPMMKLRDILGVLRDSYCRTVGIEYMHIQDPEQRELDPGRRSSAPHAKPDREEQLRILRRLNAAEAFETFLQTKYVGQKRFSPRGRRVASSRCSTRSSSAAAEAGLDEVVHRHGPPRPAQRAGQHRRQVLRPDLPRVRGQPSTRSRVQGSGDVKYHLGTEGTFTDEDGEQITVYLAANPSHLEAVDPVLEGIVRAKQDRLDQARRRLHRAADPDPRRRRVRRPGRRRRDAEPLAAARLPHRRHHPRRHQQPGRLHHRRRRPRARRSTPPTSPG